MLSYDNMNWGNAQNPFGGNTSSVIQDIDLIRVKSREEVDAFELGARRAVSLWHESEPIVYIKYRDQSGSPPYYTKVVSFNLIPEKENVTDVSFEEVDQNKQVGASMSNKLDKIITLLEALV